MAELEPAELSVFGLPTELSVVDAKEIRDALTALARTFYTTNAANPSDSRQGQLRVNGVDPTNFKLEAYINDNWRTLLQQIDKGIPSPVKQVVQITAASASWVIDHNLGSQVVPLVFDPSFIKMTPVNVFPPRNIQLARVDMTLPIGPVLLGYPLEFNGVILSTFGIVEGLPPGAGGPLPIDFLINAVPVTGGTIVAAPALPTGTLVPGTPVTGDNVFVVGDILDILATGVPHAPAGALNLWMQAQHTLNAGEYRLTQVTENRITIDHASAVTGFVVLVG